MKFTLFFFLICLIGFMACSDDSGSPEIEITSPENNSVFAPGQDINISATVTDDVGITSLDLMSPDLGIDETLTQFQDPTMFTVNFTISLDPSTPLGDYEITIVARDGDGNTDEEDLTIKVQ